MWPNPQETADILTFTEEILNGKLQFLRSDGSEEMKKINVWAFKKNLMPGNTLQENQKIAIALGKRFLLNWDSANMGWSSNIFKVKNPFQRYIYT